MAYLVYYIVENERTVHILIHVLVYNIIVYKLTIIKVVYVLFHFHSIDNLDVRYVYICAGCALSPARILLALTALLALAFGRMIHA